MRKRLLVLLMAIGMLVMSAAPAIADRTTAPGQDRIKDPQPVCALGLNNNEFSHEGFERPEQAADPLTGRINRFEHGDPHNANCEGIGW